MTGNGGLKAAYCNDQYLILHSNGKASHSDGLARIPHPPAEGSPYSSACVTRSYHYTYVAYKIALFPSIFPNDSISNNMAAFQNQTDPAGMASYGLPSSGPIGVTITGQNLYPLLNHGGTISHEMCEVDKCSAHAGQGM